MQYLIKFKNQSYRKTRWINESSFFDEYSFFRLKIKPNYDIHKEVEVNEYVNNLVIGRLQINQRPDYSIYDRRPTVDVMDFHGYA